MNPASRELFEYTARRVTREDLVDFCPGDPGYWDYVQEFELILRKTNPPEYTSSNIHETLGLTWGVEAGEVKDPIRYRRARTFANTVGVCLATGAEGPVGPYEIPPNYLAISLLDDAHALEDAELLPLLYRAFGELLERFDEQEAEEAPFILLAQLILALKGFGPAGEADALADRLIAEESRHCKKWVPGFLWGCTNYNSRHDRWMYFVKRSFPEEGGSEAVTLVRDALLGG